MSLPEISLHNIIAHISTFIGTITNGAILSSYAGFLSVSSVTVYELAIKDIFSNFAILKGTALMDNLATRRRFLWVQLLRQIVSSLWIDR